AVRREVESIIHSGPDPVFVDKLPQTPRAKKVIEFAIEEARHLHLDYVGTEHLLLGLLRERDGVAAQVLMSVGLSVEIVRGELIRLLDEPVETGIQGRETRMAGPNPETSSLPGDVLRAVRSFEVLIEQLQRLKENAVAAAEGGEGGVSAR